MPNELTGQPEEHEVYADIAAREEDTVRWSDVHRALPPLPVKPSTYRADDFTDVLRLPYLGCSRRRLSDEERARYG